MQLRSFRSLRKLGVYLLLPLLVLVIPTSWLERSPSICLISKITGKPCPGCGMTRAISSLVHGRFRLALGYNKLVVIVFPLLCWFWLQAVVMELKKASVC